MRDDAAAPTAAPAAPAWQETIDLLDCGMLDPDEVEAALAELDAPTTVKVATVSIEAEDGHERVVSPGWRALHRAHLPRLRRAA